MLKLLFKLFIYVILTVTFFYFFEAPFLLETAFAEELTSSETQKNNEITPDKKPETKTYSNILWEYRWYLLGSVAFLILGVIIYSAIYSDVPVVGAGAMPHVPGQTITDLLKVRPDLHIDPDVSKLMPERIHVEHVFKHSLNANVIDYNFIKGFRSGDQIYQVYLMPSDTPYPEVSQAFWIQEAQNQLGKVTFNDPSQTFVYTQVAVVPLDTATYTVYHKVDIVQVIQDPGYTSVPVVKTSYLFKDHEYAWFQ